MAHGAQIANTVKLVAVVLLLMIAPQPVGVPPFEENETPDGRAFFVVPVFPEVEAPVTGPVLPTATVVAASSTPPPVTIGLAAGQAMAALAHFVVPHVVVVNAATAVLAGPVAPVEPLEPVAPVAPVGPWLP